MGALKEDFDFTVGIHPTVAEEFTLLKAIAGSKDEAKTGCWSWAMWHCPSLEGLNQAEVKEFSSTMNRLKVPDIDSKDLAGGNVKNTKITMIIIYNLLKNTYNSMNNLFKNTPPSSSSSSIPSTNLFNNSKPTSVPSQQQKNVF